MVLTVIEKKLRETTLKKRKEKYHLPSLKSGVYIQFMIALKLILGRNILKSLKWKILNFSWKI